MHSWFLMILCIMSMNGMLNGMFAEKIFWIVALYICCYAWMACWLQLRIKLKLTVKGIIEQWIWNKEFLYSQKDVRHRDLERQENKTIICFSTEVYICMIWSGWSLIYLFVLSVILSWKMGFYKGQTKFVFIYKISKSMLLDLALALTWWNLKLWVKSLIG